MSSNDHLALWFTPQAIREHFMGEHPAIDAATDEQLEALGDIALGRDALYELYHRLLTEAAERLGLITY